MKFVFQEDVGTKQINLHLFRLFHQERESHESAEDLEKRNIQLAEVNKKKEKIENELREKKKDVSVVILLIPPLPKICRIQFCTQSLARQPEEKSNVSQYGSGFLVR